ncbi:MAG: YgiQ family radical SAM protein [Myxococcales bacterium]|nr:YgiQ family radical SAM protein [Myxococcales bacterium]
MVTTARTRSLMDWLPTTQKEAQLRGWDELDVILVSGDAYVDHPAFGTAVIGRIIESTGLRIALVCQPNWQDDLRDFKKFGKPRLFFGVTAGCMDSMVNKYTAGKRLRSNDAYTPNGEAGFRPDYATVSYTRILKQLYPDVPVVIGGIEASLRRVTHYDYWSDQLKPSILSESGADLLVYGMGEQPLRELVRLLEKGVPFESLKTIPQTGFLQPRDQALPKHKQWQSLALASHEDCLNNKKVYARNFKFIEQESNKQFARRLSQDIGEQTLVINPPYQTMNEQEIDASFDLPYTRLPHPKYSKRGPIPAYEMIKFSINMHRGCFGGCSFCTISAHQGKMIASRSKESIMREVETVTQMDDFRGYISDIGGPSANMYKMKGKVQEICDRCVSPSCIFPVVCHNLDTNHKPMLEIYQEVSEHPQVKKAIVSSGIRYDLFVDKEPEEDKQNGYSAYLEQLVTHHVSGRLKVAPEHTSDDVLKMMRKPSFKLFYKFKEKFDAICEKAAIKQQLIPYFISSHPGCDAKDMAHLAAETKDLGFQLEQVQDFTPTPMTVATVIYYSGYHPYTLKEIDTARTQQQKTLQRRFFFWYQKENQAWIRQTLQEMKMEKLAKKLLGDEDTEAPHASRGVPYRAPHPKAKTQHRKKRDAAVQKATRTTSHPSTNKPAHTSRPNTQKPRSSRSK